MKKYLLFSVLFLMILSGCAWETSSERKILVPVTNINTKQVQYYRQNVDQTCYELYETKDVSIPVGTKLSFFEKKYPGFIATGYNQNGTVLSVFFDRKTVTVQIDLNGGTSSNKDLERTGLFGTSLGSVIIPEKAGYVFQGFYCFGDKLSGSFPTDSGIYTAVWKPVTHTAPKGFVFVSGGTVVGSKEYDTDPKINTCGGVFIAGRTITLSDYYIAKYEVTKKLFKEIMSDSTLNTYGVSSDPSYSTNSSNYNKYVAEGEDPELLPIEGITWNDAVYFCNLFSKKDGLDPVYSISNVSMANSSIDGKSFKHIKTATVTIDLTKNGYRLPTEAEWEYAARGGNPDSKEFLYCHPTTYSEDATLEINHEIDWIAWYAGTTGAYGTKGYCSHQVGLKQPNSLGLFDMAGNAAEFVNDGFGTHQYTPPEKKGTFTDYMVTDGSHHIIRGGNWSAQGQFVTVGYRFSRGTNDHIELIGNFHGFRLARSKGTLVN